MGRGKNKERGIFAVEIILPKEGTNYLRVSAMDQNGKLILLNETDYSIIYNKNIKKIAPAILNRSLSVRVADMNDTRLDKLQPLIEKIHHILLIVFRKVYIVLKN